MRLQGKIVKWDASKGFGFVRTNGENKDIFFHISALSHRNAKPELGDTVSYTLGKDAKQRLQALEIQFANEKSAASPTTTLNPALITLFALFLALVIERTLHGALPAYVLMLVILANLLVFLMYFFDKKAAQTGNWRTQESTLHWLSLLGGWGGAHIAQKLFKHKYKKTSFMVVYWLTVLISWVLILVLSYKLA